MTRDAILFTVGVMVGLVCGLGVALADGVPASAWSTSGGLTISQSSVCTLGTISNDETVITVNWRCVEQEIQHPGGDRTGHVIAVILKAMRDGKVK